MGDRPCSAVTWGEARRWPGTPQLINLPCQACRRARAPQHRHLGFCCGARLPSPARACLPVSQHNLGHRTFLSCSAWGLQCHFPGNLALKRCPHPTPHPATQARGKAGRQAAAAAAGTTHSYGSALALGFPSPPSPSPPRPPLRSCSESTLSNPAHLVLSQSVSTQWFHQSLPGVRVGDPPWEGEKGDAVERGDRMLREGA